MDQQRLEIVGALHSTFYQWLDLGGCSWRYPSPATRHSHLMEIHAWISIGLADTPVLENRNENQALPRETIASYRDTWRAKRRLQSVPSSRMRSAY